MARQTSGRPIGIAPPAVTRTGTLKRTPTRKPASPLAPVQEETIEDRLTAKADAADQLGFVGERSLGQMTRAERRKILFGV